MKGKKKTGSLRQDPQKVLINMGRHLRKRRKEIGYTNSDNFTYDVGINRSQYGKYESGHDLKLTTLLKMVNMLGLTLEEFFSDFDSEAD